MIEIERLRQKTFDIHISDLFGSQIQAPAVQYPSMEYQRRSKLMEFSWHGRTENRKSDIQRAKS